MSSKKLVDVDMVRMDLADSWSQGFEMGQSYGSPDEGDDVPADWRDDTIEQQARTIAKLTEERNDWKDRALDLRGRIRAAADSRPDGEYSGDRTLWRSGELESLAYNVGRESRTWEDNDE